MLPTQHRLPEPEQVARRVYFLEFGLVSGYTLLPLVIIGHDVGLKLYAGGRHDAEGQDWMMAFLFMGLLPPYGLLLFHLTRPGPEPRYQRVLSPLLFPPLLLGYLYCFGNLGMGRSY